MEYLIRWKGCSPDEGSWEPEENLDCSELIRAYEESIKCKDDIFYNFS